jgi:hypothetical protein
VIRPFACLCVLALLGGLSGCDSVDAEANYKKRIDLANELSDALEKKDEAKAKSVATELNALEDKLTKTKVTESQKKRIEEKYKADNDKAAARLVAAIFSNPELAKKSGYKMTE